MIAACFTCKNEADIVETSLVHMFDQGVDRIFLADGLSTDGTRDVLADLSRDYPLTVLDDPERFHYQPHWMNMLAALAGEAGAEWIIAADVDEFWYATEGGTIAEALAECSEQKLYARSYQHLDMDIRQVEPKRLPKVAYRWFIGAEVTNGNHNVNVPSGSYGVLDLRELQFRSFEHFCTKSAARTATLDPAMRARGDGAHQTRLAGLSIEELRAEWNLMLAIPTVHDPIPGERSRALRTELRPS